MSIEKLSQAPAGDSGAMPVSPQPCEALQYGVPIVHEEGHTISHVLGEPRGVNLTPSDLPYNLPDQDRYPYARYGGLKAFTNVVPYNVAWDFLADLGASRNETPPAAFYVKAFETAAMLRAYFNLPVHYRLRFMNLVVWIRDPLPGRPGGVQPPQPDWPPNVPTPVHHTMTRYAGLDRFVGKLNSQWSEVCRMALFGIHEKFDPIWWTDYHKTVDVYTLYARLAPELRSTFIEAVYWIPDSGLVSHLEDRRKFPDRETKYDPTARYRASCIKTSSEGVAKGTSGLDVAVGHSAPVFAKVVPDIAVPVEQPPDDKLCYLQLFRSEHRSLVHSRLGSNPWGAAVAHELLKSPGTWSSGKFHLSFGSWITNDGSAYTQAHVERSSDGTPITHLVQRFSGIMRVGATGDLNALLNTQSQDMITAKPTIFPTLPIGGGPGIELSFDLFAIVGKDTLKYPSVNFNIMKEPVFLLLLGAFESVQLQHAHFNVSVSTGATNVVYAAICGESAVLAELTDWLGAPVNTMIHGSDQGYTDGVFVLPEVHQFERELRALSLTGNPVPTFRFSFAGSTGGLGTIKGSFTVRVRGQHALGHVRIGIASSTKGLRQHAERMLATMPAVKSGGTFAPGSGTVGDEDDDSDDGEPFKPNAGHRPSPPRQSGGAPRPPGISGPR